MKEKGQAGAGPGGGDSIQLDAIQPSTSKEREKKTDVTHHKRFRSRTLRVLRKRKLRHARDRNPEESNASIRYEKARARRLDKLRRLESRHVRQELSPFFQLRSRAKEIYNTIENTINTVFEKVESNYEQYKFIPILLLKLEDPGLDFETYQYYMERISPKHDHTAYDDWAWFYAAGGAQDGARGQQRTQRYEAALAKVPGIRPLQDDERNALSQTAFHYYDPDDNKQRILRKFHKERREFVSRKPSWNARRFRSPRDNLGNPTVRMRLKRFLADSPVMQVFMKEMCCLRYTLTYLTTGRFKTSSRNSNSTPSDFDDYEYPLENLPTLTYCSEVNLHKKIENLPEVIQAAASKCVGSSSITVSSSAKSALCMPSKFACWRTPSYDKVLPGTAGTSSSFSVTSDNSEEFVTTSSTVPGDPYQNIFIIDSEEATIPEGSKVFREDELHLLRPYGETRPVFVYKVSLERAANAQKKEPIHVEPKYLRYARPPCLCRPGFPQRGHCRNPKPPLRKKELPYMKWCGLILLFFIKLCLATAIASGMLYFLLDKSKVSTIATTRVNPQTFLNTYIDTGAANTEICKYYIYRSEESSISLTVKIRGPFDDSGSVPELKFDLVRLYFDKSTVNKANIETNKAAYLNVAGSTKYSEEKTDVTSMKKTETQTFTCAPNLNNAAIQANKGVWYWFKVTWSYKFTDNGLDKVTQTRTTKSMVIAEFFGVFTSTDAQHTIEWISTKKEHRVAGVFTKPMYQIETTSCYYTYSKLDIVEPPSKTKKINWNEFHFDKFKTTDDIITSAVFEDYDNSPGRVHNKHYVYGNFCTVNDVWASQAVTCDNPQTTIMFVRYAFKYCIAADSTANKEQSVAFAISIGPTSTQIDATITAGDKKKVNYLIGGLYLLLLLQVHRTTSVMIMAIGSYTVLSSVYLLPTEDLATYFKIEYVLPYVFFMMWNACLSETGLYDVFAIYSVKYLRKFALIVPALWFCVIGTTMLTDNVTAMLLLTPIAIRVFEELYLDPRPVLKSMIMMANIMSMYKKDGSLYSRMLIKDHLDLYQRLSVAWNILICFGVSIIYFTLYFYIFKTYTQKHNGLNVLKHELKLWILVDGSHSPGGGMQNYMQTLFCDELHCLLKEQKHGLPVRLYKRHTRIREGAGKILVEMGFMMILFSLIGYHYRKDYGTGGYGPQEFIYLFFGLCLLLRADIKWLTPFRVIWQRINLSSILTTTALIFIGNVFVKFELHESIKSSADANNIISLPVTMLLISSALSAVLGLSATSPLIKTMKLYGTNTAQPLIVKATTLGINIGGTATMLGSMTALVTAGAADLQGHQMGMIRYILTMLPVTVLNILCNLLTMM